MYVNNTSLNVVAKLAMAMSNKIIIIVNQAKVNYDMVVDYIWRLQNPDCCVIEAIKTYIALNTIMHVYTSHVIIGY